MSFTAAMILASLTLLSRWHLMLMAGRAWRGISDGHVEYARSLYTSGIDQAFYGVEPLHWIVLFRHPVLDALRETARRLRVAVVVNGVLGASALIYVPAAVFHAVRSI